MVVLAIFVGLGVINNSSVSASTTPKLLRVYRLNNSSGASDQIITTSRTKADSLIATNQWAEQFINWSDNNVVDNKAWVYDRQIPGTMPIYCLYNSQLTLHMITSSTSERQLLLSAPGWSDYVGCGTNQANGLESNILGYVFREKTPGTSQVYQLYKPINNSSNLPGSQSIMVTTMIKSTADSLIQNFGYSYYGSGIKTPHNSQSPVGTIGYLLQKEHKTANPINSQPYYEINYPSGTFANQSPKGIMVFIHGGSWIWGDNSIYVTSSAIRNDAKWWSDLGWQVINIDYHPGKGVLDSVKQTYSRIKAWKPNSTKCVWGQSAGGQLALMTAAAYPDIKCAISHGGPLDLLALLPGSLKDNAVAFFCTNETTFQDQSCKNQLSEVSPKQNGQITSAKVLVAANITETTVTDPIQQLDSYKVGRSGKQVWVAKLNSGTNSYIHKNIDNASNNLIYNTLTGLQKKLADCVLGVTGATDCTLNKVYLP